MIDKAIKMNSDCMGCHGCQNICPKNCISMELDKEGFLYPNVNYDLCVKCNKCIDICPIIYKTSVDNTPVAYACINKNEEIRMASSSGGLFTLISKQVMDMRGVVFGASFNNKFELEHNYVYNAEDLSKLRGSKYLQSKIGYSFKLAKDFLDSGRKVLFSGTPCQIAGLQSYLMKPYDNLLTLDIICHGVPSPNVWRKYLEFRERESHSSIQRITFRQKNEGWKRFSVLFLFDNNTEYRRTLVEDLYMKAFLSDICLRPSCYNCKFKTLHRQSDMTLADFWGIENILPEMDDDKGTSLIFVNSKNGKEIFDSMSNDMIFTVVDINEAVKYNSAAIKSAKNNPNRDGFMKEKDNLPFDVLVRKYCPEPLQTRFMNKIRTGIKRCLVPHKRATRQPGK